MSAVWRPHRRLQAQQHEGPGEQTQDGRAEGAAAEEQTLEENHDRGGRIVQVRMAAIRARWKMSDQCSSDRKSTVKLEILADINFH